MRDKHILDSLGKYMFSTKNISCLHSKDMQIMQKPKPPQKQEITCTSKQSSADSDGIYPHQTDKLFWCFYIIRQGKDAYEYVGQGEFKVESSTKIQTIEQLGNYKAQLKQCKLKNNDIENELLNEKRITISGLQALCIVHNISLMYVCGRTYYEINLNNTEVHHLIEKYDSTKISVRTDVGKDKIVNIRKNYFRIVNINKPLLSISSYKLDQLREFCVKFNISAYDALGRQKKKAKLYEEIIQQI